MHKYNFCIGLREDFGLPIEKQLEKLKAYGFDAFFTECSENVPKYKELADKLGLVYQSVHAPSVNAAKLWQSGDEAKAAKKELLECISLCVQNEIPTLVIHAYEGFDGMFIPTMQGFENFNEIVDDAAAFDVNIAVENTAGYPYLEALLEGYAYCDRVGFCWNSGHELCYNKGADLLSRFGSRLTCITLNDNFGMRGETLSAADDMHLLPFDGITDWERVAARLSKCSYDGFLTLDIRKVGVSMKDGITKYEDMTFEKFLDYAFGCAYKLRTLIKRQQP